MSECFLGKSSIACSTDIDERIRSRRISGGKRKESNGIETNENMLIITTVFASSRHEGVCLSLSLEIRTGNGAEERGEGEIERFNQWLKTTRGFYRTVHVRISW